MFLNNAKTSVEIVSRASCSIPVQCLLPLRTDVEGSRDYSADQSCLISDMVEPRFILDESVT